MKQAFHNLAVPTKGPAAPRTVPRIPPRWSMFAMFIGACAAGACADTAAAVPTSIDKTATAIAGWYLRDIMQQSSPAAPRAAPISGQS